MLFFGSLRNAIWTLFTTLSHDCTLWKWVIKRYILEVSFGSTSRVLFESAKIRQESPQTRKQIEKGSKHGSLLLPGKKSVKGVVQTPGGVISSPSRGPMCFRSTISLILSLFLLGHGCLGEAVPSNWCNAFQSTHFPWIWYLEAFSCVGKHINYT